MPKKFYKILSFVICFCFVFEQISLAQVTAQLDIASHLAQLHNAFAPEKFRPLHLRYLAYDTVTNNFSLLLDKGSTTAIENSDLENTAQSLMKYFFVGLALPNESFWVNLRPDTEENIIDSSLEQTDVGRIMLEADVQLKKDTAKYTSPETASGKEYWDKLYKKAGELFGYENITIPTLTRPWIVPGTIIITETKDGAYIYKAQLKVMLEQDYLKGSAVFSFKDERLRALNEYSSQLIRELVIPQVTKEVNSSKKYASLRQAYYSLIFAQWFKQKFPGRGGYYSQLIDTKDLTNLISKIPWSKSTYFQEYQQSFKDGEYNIKEPAYTPYGQTIRSYFSGGLALTVKPENLQSTTQEVIPQRPYQAGVNFRSTRPNEGEAKTTPRRRDDQGRFLNEEGKSPEDMVRILNGSEYRDKPFTVEQYRTLWQKVYGSELPESTAYSDLRGAIEKTWIEQAGDLPQYRLTSIGIEAAFSQSLPGQWRISSHCSIICREMYRDLEIYYLLIINALGELIELMRSDRAFDLGQFTELRSRVQYMLPEILSRVKSTNEYGVKSAMGHSSSWAAAYFGQRVDTIDLLLAGRFPDAEKKRKEILELLIESGRLIAAQFEMVKWRAGITNDAKPVTLPGVGEAALAGVDINRTLSVIDELRDEETMVGGISAKQVAERLKLADVAQVETMLRGLVKQGYLVSYVTSTKTDVAGDAEFKRISGRHSRGETDSVTYLKEHDDLYRRYGGERFLLSPSEIRKRPFSTSRAAQIISDGAKLRRFTGALSLFFCDRLNPTLYGSQNQLSYYLDEYIDEQTRGIAKQLNEQLHSLRRDSDFHRKVTNAWSEGTLEQLDQDTVRGYLLDMQQRMTQIRDLIERLRSQKITGQGLSPEAQALVQSYSESLEAGYAHFCFVYDVYSVLANSLVTDVSVQSTPTTPLGADEAAAAKVTQKEIDIFAERIRDIHHDLTGVLQLPIDIAHTVKEHYPNETETVELCTRIVRLCGQLAKDSCVIRDYVVQGKKGNVQVNVRSYVETSKQLIGLFTHEQIALLKQQYAASRVGEKSAQETTSHLWLFENCCKGLKLVLGTNLGLLPQERRLISLHELLDVTSAIEGRPTQNIVLQRDYSPQTYYIRGDEGEFFRIFANIIRNAREAVFDFGGRIGIQTSSEADSVVIRITDTGKGMPDEKVDAFNSGQSVSSDKGESRGRGLAIVRELVNNNGGSVLAESDVAKGTTFTIRLPIAQDTPPSSPPDVVSAGNTVGSINVPKSPSSMPASGAGGIVFGALPIINLTDFSFGSVSSIPMATLNINQEFEEIQKLIAANIRPSRQRIAEYLYACTNTHRSAFSLNCALSCIADILRLEEE